MDWTRWLYKIEVMAVLCSTSGNFWYWLLHYNGHFPEEAGLAGIPMNLNLTYQQKLDVTDGWLSNFLRSGFSTAN